MTDNQYLKDWIYALWSFFDNDNVLLNWNWFHEQAISHRIAYYLEYYFRNNNRNNKNFSFDCEYNKIWDWNPKTFDSSEMSWREYIIKYKGKEFKWVEVLREEKYLLIYIKEKNITIIREEDKFSLKSLKSSQIRPDIIIHKRWKNWKDDNLAVFEIKKWKLDSKDILKLKWFTSKNLNFHYQYWVWLSNFKKNEETVEIGIYQNWKYELKLVYKNKTKTIEKID